MVGLPDPGPQKFMWPVFVVSDPNANIPIESLPGQARLGVDQLKKQLEAVIESGVNSILIFGVDDQHKDNEGSYAHRDDGVVQKAVREIRLSFPDLLVFTDVCLCAYTNHGHCGPLTKTGDVDNDAALEQLAMTAVSHAAAGAHGVAPSSMMDGQVQAIRGALNEAGSAETILMSYSTKFASAMYGPFRDAAGSAPGKGDRNGYQAPANDARQAIRESLLDIDEGADILMVKPAMLYLDLISRLRQETQLPLAAYNVSGEYSMVHAMAEKGWADLGSLARESLMALQRAGADILISYWANQYSRLYGQS
jgi:porphobilinogen synthase